MARLEKNCLALTAGASGPTVHLDLIAGLPYSFAGQSTMEEISGNSPYGASCIAGPDGSKMPNQFELDGAFYQGQHVAKILSSMK